MNAFAGCGIRRSVPCRGTALTGQFLRVRLRGIEPAERIQLRRRREVHDVLHLRHHRDLVRAVRQVRALARRADVVAVEVRRALLEFGEVLDRAQRALGAVDLLVEHAAQARRVEAEARRLRAHVGREVERCVGVEVGVAVEAGHAQARSATLAVLRLVELLLRERRQQQPQPLHLHRREMPFISS
jgi:hypothetical protein